MELRVLAPVRYLTSRKCADASEVTVTETDHTQNKDTRFVFAELPQIAASRYLLIFTTHSKTVVDCTR